MRTTKRQRQRIEDAASATPAAARVTAKMVRGTIASVERYVQNLLAAGDPFPLARARAEDRLAEARARLDALKGRAS